MPPDFTVLTFSDYPEGAPLLNQITTCPQIIKSHKEFYSKFCHGKIAKCISNMASKSVVYMKSRELQHSNQHLFASITETSPCSSALHTHSTLEELGSERLLHIEMAMQIP